MSWEGAHRRACQDPARQPRECTRTRELSHARVRARAEISTDGCFHADLRTGLGALHGGARHFRPVGTRRRLAPIAASTQTGARGWVLCMVALVTFAQTALPFCVPPSTAAVSSCHTINSHPSTPQQWGWARRGAARRMLEMGAACGTGLGHGGGIARAARSVFAAWGAQSEGDSSSSGCGRSGVTPSALACNTLEGREVRQRGFSRATAMRSARRGGGGRQGSGRPFDGDGDDMFDDSNGFPDRISSEWDGGLDAEWELRVRGARSPKKGRGVLRDPWQDKTHTRVLLPQTPHKAMLQAVDAVDHALDQGVFRLRVQMNLAELDLNHQTLSQSSLPVLLNELTNKLLARGLRVCLLFNTLRDASDAKINLHPDLLGKVAISVLGLGEFSEAYDVAVLVCASNEGHENLRRIEEVERLIYAGPPKDMTKKVDKTRFMQRPIILINPSLEAIHSMATTSNKVI